MSAQRDEKGRLLPGQTANPTGRPKGGNGLATRIRELSNNGEELVEFLFRVVRGEEKCSGRERLEATAKLLDRGFGKAIDITASLDLNQTEGNPFRDLATEALMKIAAALKEGREDGSTAASDPSAPGKETL